ncbi:hypothetical protein BO86DRAFT_438270 [Aspergillus japonicus CBS 114.51]|uniref:Uncharacterized protein n=2 Tax=Aspergillus TaxID=5052 RepID=A0A2V5H6K9_ASPV1|nr:hypothetical protein BO86DRAFT_438270 [Aspergillus japonicus CBS 114.51]PYI19858.1 hypothetical protein BO99DRAFT_332161 [Aspergillus violaceofuscus CBS 115571]RAH78501.1 hypothetical protein BO86DRAFT_438270 [Aspergillus japonicus CBS 114.51]
MSMYHHHQAELGERPNYGWLQTMYFSTSQQLIHQDPVYYLLYILACSDHNWKLILYPCYATFTQPNDSTFFCYIDINMTKAVKTGRGAHAIQGSLLLDNKWRAIITEGGTWSELAVVYRDLVTGPMVPS